MKKLFPLILVFVLFFTACTQEKITPVLPASFTQRAEVSTGDFSYSCEICKTAESVSVKVLSTAASGMLMTCDGGNMNFEYDGMTQDIDSSSMPKANAALLLFEAFENLSGDSGTKPSAVNDGYRYQGKISAGDFVLVTDKNMRPKTFAVKQVDLSIIFS